MKRKKLLVLLLAAAVVFFGVNWGYRSYRLSQAPDFIKNFTREEALEDYDEAWRVIEENYPYYGVVKRMYGVDLTEIKTRYRNRLNSEASLDYLKFYEILNRSLQEANGIGHLMLFTPDFYDYIMDGLDYDPETQTIQNPNTEGIGFLLPQLTQPRSAQAFAYLHSATLSSLFAKNQVQASLSPEKQLTMEVLDEDTLYIQFFSCYVGYIERDRAQIADFIRANSDKPNLIIDITRNAGGNDYYWMKCFVEPMLAAPITCPVRYLVKGGAENQQILSLNGTPPEGFSTDLSPLYALPKIHTEDLDDMWGMLTGSFTLSPALEEPLYTGNIFLLIDKGTHSSAAGFAHFSKETGWATLVGNNNTKGDGAGGITPIYHALPNSGLIFSYRMSYAISSDGSLSAEVGTTPHIPSPEGETPLETCQKFIAQQRSETPS